MTRPVRAYGRPKTRVIPDGWGPSHAAVTDDTLTDLVVIYRPTGDPVWDPAQQSPVQGSTVIYGGTLGAAATVTAGDSTRTTQGGQDVAVGRYTVRLPHAVDIHPAAAGAGPLDELRIHVTASDDPTLVGRVLVVDDATLAGRRFSRFLTATLVDLTGD